ncbi:hypothetical protein IFM89_015796 [Coptis chinensis]|uniref:PPM-type phosphatase domain-containing protein n=1 Tax=Coptis chinensis TaxID=261450 RepID=A0A835IP76_9MAGN|nr:hypothetical protein IFM89_015796 [Coptis chinensis]
MLGETDHESDGGLKISFGYQCNGKKGDSCELSNEYKVPYGIRIPNRSSSFSCLSGAALSANATLANTNICNGLIGAGILPTLDSPKSFRRIPSSPSLVWSDVISSSFQSGISYLSCSPSSSSDPCEWDSHRLQSVSAPTRSEGFLNATEVEVAGGAAGEDRVQAVCSEENGWLFCAIYDGFNGRDAADFLAGTLYDTIGFYLRMVDTKLKQENFIASDGSLQCSVGDDNSSSEENILCRVHNNNHSKVNTILPRVRKKENPHDSFKDGVRNSLQRALSQAESDFLNMVEQEMEDRPDLVSVGSCVLVVLLHGEDMYTLNLGDSRAVLATYGETIDMNGIQALDAVQLTDSHTVDNELERKKLLYDHPDDPATIVAGRVKGKLKITRAFGVGYLKKGNMNDALMGILKVRNLLSPPYISTQPSLHVHRISKQDHFVIVGSDGLFDFFSNDDAVRLVHSYILSNPSGDPAKFLLEQLVFRAANCAEEF